MAKTMENAPADGNRLFVIGGSAGAVNALIKIVSALPEGFPAAVLIVIHVGAKSILPEVLSRCANMPIARTPTKPWSRICL